MIHTTPTGIDISKDWFDVCALVKKEMAEHRFKQNRQGYEALLDWAKAQGIKKMHVCMESTGGYETELALFLRSKDHLVSIVASERIRGHKACQGKRRKTDRLDAKAIAEFCKMYKPEVWNPRPDAYQTLTHLVRFRENLLESKTVWTNRLGSPNDVSFVRQQTDALIQMLTMQLQILEGEIRQLVDKETELKEAVEILTSCKGAKFWTAAKFLAEAGPISGYCSSESLSLAAGVAPIPMESGKTIGLRKVPIYGNIRLRQAVEMAATVAKRHNPALAQFADRLTRNGKPKRLITRAVQRKILEIFWAMLTNKQPFDPYKAVKDYKPAKA
jgi:transposase